MHPYALLLPLAVLAACSPSKPDGDDDDDDDPFADADTDADSDTDSDADSVYKSTRETMPHGMDANWLPSPKKSPMVNP